MRALKSRRYVKIMNIKNSMVFYNEIFDIYSVLSFKLTCCIKFDYVHNDEVLTILRNEK